MVLLLVVMLSFIVEILILFVLILFEFVEMLVSLVSNFAETTAI